MLGKKSSVKSEKNAFLYSHIYRYQIMGGKNARNNFSRNTKLVRSKNVGKNRRKKVRKTFFYIHTNIVTKKWGEQNARNNFSSKDTNSESKKCWEKNLGKKCENVFYIPTNIVTKKWGGKKRETIFPETH